MIYLIIIASLFLLSVIFVGIIIWRLGSKLNCCRDCPILKEKNNEVDRLKNGFKDVCNLDFECASKSDCRICSNDCMARREELSLMARLMFLLFCFVIGIIAVWSIWHLVEFIFNSLN